MVSLHSLWLLSVSLLSWCDALVLVVLDPESEPGLVPVMMWTDVGE